MNETFNSFSQLCFYYLDVIRNVFQLLPEIAIFLSIGFGFFIGSKKMGPIQLGGVCGTLIVALLLGQCEIAIPSEVKNVFFALFIFALGYVGGPQFFNNLNAKGLRLGIFSLIEVCIVLFIAWIAMKTFSLDPGTAAGLIAGAATESAVIGTASEAISKLPLSYTHIQSLQANVVTAYSVTYIFGLLTIVLFTSQIIPLILKKNMQEEAKKLWASLGSYQQNNKTDETNAAPEMIGRTFIVKTAKGKSVSQINSLLGKNTFIESIYRNKKSIDVSDDVILKLQDIVLIFGNRNAVIHAESIIGEECAKTNLINSVMENETYIVSSKQGSGLTLGDLAKKIQKSELTQHVHLASITRNGHIMPLVSQLILQTNDQIHLLGAPEVVKQAGEFIGFPLIVKEKTNLIYIGFGLILGILIGQITVPLKGIELSLGTGGGALLTGLLFGWFQTKCQRISPTSSAALELMKDIGLAIFVACIGLSAGKQAVVLIKEYGLILPLAGITISLIPAVLSFFVGHYFLKLELPILLGGIAGQQCSTPALSAVQVAAGNATPLMGYTITYAISNVLLPLLGPIIIGIGFA